MLILGIRRQTSRERSKRKSISWGGGLRKFGWRRGNGNITSAHRGSYSEFQKEGMGLSSLDHGSAEIRIP